jgi:hypothetical protein
LLLQLSRYPFLAGTQLVGSGLQDSQADHLDDGEVSGSGVFQHPFLAGAQFVADAFGHAMQAAAGVVAAEAMLRELLVIAAGLEDRAFW